MNFIVVCLHCLDMRDFHSHLRETPFLDSLRKRSIFVPAGRAQGHHQHDSLNAELTGIWAARHCDSALTEHGFHSAENCWLPPTVIEFMQRAGYDVITRIAWDGNELDLGSHAVNGGMREFWLRHEPERLAQFSSPRVMDIDDSDGGKFQRHVSERVGGRRQDGTSSRRCGVRRMRPRCTPGVQPSRSLRTSAHFLVHTVSVLSFDPPDWRFLRSCSFMAAKMLLLLCPSQRGIAET